MRLVNRDPDLGALIITGVGDVFAPGGDMGGRSEPGDVAARRHRTGRPPVPGHPRQPGAGHRGGQRDLSSRRPPDRHDGRHSGGQRAGDLPRAGAPRGIPDATFAAALPAHVGLAVARDLLLSARPFDAAEAQRLGVISRVVSHDDLHAAATTAAAQVLRTAPPARVQVKRMLNERYGAIDYQTMFWALDHSDEPREGMRAFMENVRPVGTRRTSGPADDLRMAVSPS